jgi:hypothetical protein
MTNNNRQRQVHFEETHSVGVTPEVECSADEEQEKRWYTVSTVLKRKLPLTSPQRPIFNSTNHFFVSTVQRYCHSTRFLQGPEETII